MYHSPSLPSSAIWALHVIALLPALLGKLFRKLEPKGVRPWIQLVGKCREHASEDIRALSTLLWNHLAFAFMRTTLDDGSVWVFRADGKPFQLLIQLFGATTTEWGDAAARTTSGPPKDRAYALTLAGTLYGLNVLNLGLPATPAGDAQLENLDFVWDRVVAVALRGAMGSLDTEIAAVGWAILAALVKAPAAGAPLPMLDALINRAFLDGVPAKGKVVPTGELARRAFAAATQPDQIPGWAARWTVSRAAKVLGLVEQVLGLVDLPESTVVQVFGVSAALLDGASRANIDPLPFLKPNIFVFWRNFLTSLETAGAFSPRGPNRDHSLI